MKFSFSLLHRSMAYWLALGSFAAANLYSWLRYRSAEPECCDQLITTGFPFPFHVSGGYSASKEFLVTGLLLDIIVAWTLAVFAAWIGLTIRSRRLSDTD